MKEKIYGEKIFHNDIVFEGKVKFKNKVSDSHGSINSCKCDPDDAKDIILVKDLPDNPSPNKLYKLPNGTLYSYIDSTKYNYMMNGQGLDDGINVPFQYQLEGVMTQTTRMIDIDTRNGKFVYRGDYGDTQANAGTVIYIPLVQGELTIATHPGYHNYKVNGTAATDDVQTFTFNKETYVKIEVTDSTYFYYISELPDPRWRQLDNTEDKNPIVDSITFADGTKQETAASGGDSGIKVELWEVNLQFNGKHVVFWTPGMSDEFKNFDDYIWTIDDGLCLTEEQLSRLFAGFNFKTFSRNASFLYCAGNFQVSSTMMFVGVTNVFSLYLVPGQFLQAEVTDTDVEDIYLEIRQIM